MTDGWLMEAPCIHGVTWYECETCGQELGELLTADDGNFADERHLTSWSGFGMSEPATYGPACELCGRALSEHVAFANHDERVLTATEAMFPGVRIIGLYCPEP